MVDAYGQHRYFIRTGLSTRPMEAHEVERAFRELGATEERVAALVRELPLVPRIDRSRFRPNEEATGREPAGSPWTSLVTIPLDRSGVMLSMRTPGHHDFPLVDVGSAFIGDPAYILHGGYSVNEWGYTSEDFDPHENLVHRTRLYREGACEWGVRYSGDNFQHIPTVVVVENVHDALAYFASVYQRLDYFGRLRVWVRIDNADRSEFKIDPNYILRGGPRPPDGDALSAETETNVEALLADPMPLVHEAMDLIWQGYGLPRAFLFSPEGEFLKRRR